VAADGNRGNVRGHFDQPQMFGRWQRRLAVKHRKGSQQVLLRIEDRCGPARA
jgi:hypothetical protein